MEYYAKIDPKYREEFLKHYGIKGQSWGIRRYQNEDGTLTEEGKKRYGIDLNQATSEKKYINRFVSDRSKSIGTNHQVRKSIGKQLTLSTNIHRSINKHINKFSNPILDKDNNVIGYQPKEGLNEKQKEKFIKDAEDIREIRQTINKLAYEINIGHMYIDEHKDLLNGIRYNIKLKKPKSIYLTNDGKLLVLEEDKITGKIIKK